MRRRSCVRLRDGANDVCHVVGPEPALPVLFTVMIASRLLKQGWEGRVVQVLR